MNRFIVTGALAAVTGSGAFLAAQSSAPPSPAQKPAEASPATPVVAQKTAPTTLVGCVYREKDVPGRAPNVAERAGLSEDYIFAEVPSSPIAKQLPGNPDAPGQIPTPVGTSGTSGAMYKLEFVDGDKLKSLVGRRVEVVGRIDAEPGDQPAPAPGQRSTTIDKIVGHDRVNLSEFEVSSIREVTGTCPATPDPRP